MSSKMGCCCWAIVGITCYMAFGYCFGKMTAVAFLAGALLSRSELYSDMARGAYSDTENDDLRMWAGMCVIFAIFIVALELGRPPW